MQDPAVVKIQTIYGVFDVHAKLDKKMAEGLRCPDYPNEGLLEIMRAFATKQDTVVDIGAHIGTFSIPAATIAKEVIAFEPSQQSFTQLSQNSQQNEANLTLHNLALGSTAGQGALRARAHANAGAHSLVSGTDFEITTVDEKVARADFIKLDVEGMELQVLLGAQKLIKNSRPVVLFEINLFQLRSHGASVQALQRYFNSREYVLFYPMRKRGVLILGEVKNAMLLTACLAPRSWFLRGDSAPYDLVAVPKERVLPMPRTGFGSVIGEAIRHNAVIKGKRLRAFLR